MQIQETQKIKGREEAGVCQYRLAIYPDEEFVSKINTERNLLLEEFGQKAGEQENFQVSFFSFNASEEMEGTLIRWLLRIAGSMQQFPVVLNNYSGFPDGVVYLRIQDQQPFFQLRNQLKSLAPLVILNGEKNKFLNPVPHLKIAGPPSMKSRESFLRFCSQKMFHEKFSAKEFVLEKRNNSFGNYRQIAVFRMQPEK